MRLLVKDIVVLPRCQCRHGINPDAVNRYADHLQAGGTLPNIKVAYDKETTQYFLFDGEHTLRAHQKLALLEIDVDVDEGNAELAAWWAIAQNATHGLPRAVADREKAILNCINHPMSKDMTEEDIANYVGTSRREVFRVRQKHEAPKTERTRDHEYESAIATIRKDAPNLADDISIGINKTPRDEVLRLATKPDQERAELLPVMRDQKLTLKQAEKVVQYTPKDENLPMRTFIDFTQRNPEERIYYFRDTTVRVDVTIKDQ